MTDLFCVVITLIFFAASVGFVLGSQRLMEV